MSQDDGRVDYDVEHPYAECIDENATAIIWANVRKKIQEKKADSTTQSNDDDSNYDNAYNSYKGKYDMDNSLENTTDQSFSDSRSNNNYSRRGNNRQYRNDRNDGYVNRRGNDDGYTNRRGGYSRNDRDDDGYSNRRGNDGYSNRRGNDAYSNRRGDDGYSNRRGDDDGYSNRREDDGGYSNRRGNDAYSNRRGDDAYSNRRGDDDGYSNRRGDDGGYSNRRGNDGYSNRRGDDDGYSNRRGDDDGYTNRRGDDNGYSNRRGGNDRYSRRGNNDRYGNQQSNNSESYQNNSGDGNYSSQREGYGSRGGGSRHVFGEEGNRYEDAKNDYGNQEDYSDVPRREPITYTPEDIQDTEEALFNLKISEGIDFSRYQNIPVDVSGGGDVSIPQRNSFKEFGLNDRILKNVTLAGYHTPTPVQKLGIPAIMDTDKDYMGCAQTGSGKTAAFLLPIFTKMIADGDVSKGSSEASPSLLVLAPTRELTSQIYNEMRKFAYGTNIRCCQVYGGVSKGFIMRQLEGGCHALSATPGRLIMHVNRGEIDLQSVKYVVLDEADRMLDMGFIPDVKKILQSFGIPPVGDRRCFMFSATFPKAIQQLAAEFLSEEYLFITIGVVGGAADSISQKLECVKVFEKKKLLLDTLYEFESGTKVLIFVETKRQADYITVYLCQSGINAVSIHGDRYQEQREEALRMFKRGECSILVATSVAARGLDVPEISVVINYDLPKSVDEYVHRIGRTGRIGNRGAAISFFQKDLDEPIAKGLVNILENAGQEVPDWLNEITGSGYSGGSSYTHQSRDVRQSGGSHTQRSFNASNSNPYKMNDAAPQDENNAAWEQHDNGDEEW